MSIIIVRVYRFINLGPCVTASNAMELPRFSLNHEALGFESFGSLPEVAPLPCPHGMSFDPIWIVIVTILLFFVQTAIFPDESQIEEKDELLNFDFEKRALLPASPIVEESTSSIFDDFQVDHTWDIQPEKLSISSNVDDGVNGVYFVNTVEDNEVFGVFKPAHEEAFAPGNQKARIGNLNEESPLKSGAFVGDAFKKEVAAYLLDHNGFAKVPATKFVSMSANDGESKLGSLQRFVANVGSSEDFSSSKFCVKDVHAIGLLDTRIGNLDRHGGNMLVSSQEKDLSLIPIDHGFSFPDYRKMKDLTFDWLSWKQASVPFSEETKQYIGSLDLVGDSRILTKLELRDASIVSYLMCSTFTQEAVAAGWTLKMIGEFMQRDLINDDLPSKFEALIDEYIALHNFQGINFQEESCEVNKEVMDFLGTFRRICADKISGFH